MRTFTGIIVIAITSLLWFQTTQADEDSVASLGPQLGISKSPDGDANWVYGAAMRLKLHPALGVEGSLNYRQEQLAGDAYTVRSWPLQATGMLYFLPPLVYGAVGAGWYMSTIDAEGTFFNGDLESEFGWHFGAGLEIPLGGMKLVGDLRYVFLNYAFEAVPGNDEIDSDFYTATAGLQFNL